MKPMLRTFATCLAFLALLLISSSTAFAKMPADMSEYQERYSKEAVSPEGAVQLWIEAIFLYQDGSTRDLGKRILLDITDKLPSDFERNGMHATFVDRIKNQPEIIRSYCAGSSPENNYKADPNKCELNISDSKEDHEGNWNIFLKSSGADSVRKIVLVKKDNHWKIQSYPGIYMGIRPAAKK